jgi:biopolymer transport protein ExbD
MKATSEEHILQMVETCSTPYGCEWSFGYLWRWMNWLGRLDVIALGLLLIYTLTIVIHAAYHFRVARRAREIDSASRRKLVAELNVKVACINGIAFTAPYLGLVGACCGVMSALTGIDMEIHAGLARVTSIMAAALVTTAAGIIVAVSATCSYNYLRTRLDLHENEAPIPRFPLEKRFSEPPAFAPIVASALAISITAFISFPSAQSPKGLDVRVLKIGGSEPEHRPRFEPVLIRLVDTSGGLPTMFVNSRRTPLSELRDALQGSLKPERIVNVAADKNVLWADVASAINAAEGLDGEVVLLTSPPIPYRGHNW